ncbi:MAG: AAA family ATPase [Deltaproteobacteria bacterium]|nr:AAA family ATPase [Deltaproteobacteria bacterium]
MADPAFRLDHLSVSGYRCLDDVGVDLRGLNIVIGPNGAGKSTFLDAFLMLAAATRGGGIAEAFARRGGFARMLTFGRKDASMRISIASSPQPWPGGQAPSPIQYSLDLRQSGTGFSIASEVLQQRREPAVSGPFYFVQRDAAHAKIHDPHTTTIVEPDWALIGYETVLSALVRTHAEVARFRTHLAGATLFPPAPLDERSALRLPQTFVPTASIPAPDGSNLVSVLQKIRAEHEDHWEQLEDALRAGFPTFRKLEWAIVGAGQAALAWHDTRFKDPLFANELSSGMLRFTLLCTLLLCPDPPPIILLDEPELSLHPELLRILAELLLQAAARTQIIVATHAESLLRWFKPEHVIVVDSQDGKVAFSRGDTLDLDRWMKDYTLDELWRMGELGGRP